ncbi:M42 family peptidase [Eubacterium sp.]|uniref:M42 family metallopeptidase n=1 Tax=Eubacterium sp. TaxID=142586 RepID=UPI0025BFDD30|nr:M42 family peptidase [Eubacterium sp.]
MLKELCLINGTSGDEGKVRDYIITQIKDYCEYSVDNMGSIIAYKKGKKAPKQKISINAHMDEVGFIVTGITDDGYLRFTSVGGIDSRVCLDRIVTVGKKAVKGVIGDKAFHLLSSDEKDRCPSFDDLLIDIGATSKDEAEQYVSLGDFAYFDCDYVELGNGYIKAKALDDRIGCMLMIELIKSELEYDTVFCFNVQEEVGLRGSKCTSYAVDADIAIVLESTTAADLDGVSGENRVCVLGDGPVISFMDNRTIYDRELFELGFTVAKENNIPAQTKTAVAGGNDAGAIQTSGDGARVMAISLPTRYIHSGASVVKASDIDETRRLLKALLPKLTD